MKKNILGLLLTVGISGFSFASSNVINKNKIFPKTSVVACYTSTITNYVDAEGNLVKTEQSPWVVISCGNAPNGTRVIKSLIEPLPRDASI